MQLTTYLKNLGADTLTTAWQVVPFFQLGAGANG